MNKLIEKLPKIRGSYHYNESMSRHTWFGVGGPADVVFSPADIADLAKFLTACPAEIPIFPVGAGSNLLVRDGGIGGVVVKLSKAVKRISHEGNRIIAEAGANDAEVARYAQKAGITGLEFLVGIPGTIGGGLRMNAGSYGREFCDVTAIAHGFDRAGNPFSATPAEMGMAYRHSDAPLDWIFTAAELQGRDGDPDDIKSRMKEIIASRGHAQPRLVRTGGSTFANPDGGKAWREIDRAGCRGLSIGGAQVSEKHCNFLINTGAATAADIESLGELVRERVLTGGGPDLRWEIQRIGRKQKKEAA